MEKENLRQTIGSLLGQAGRLIGNLLDTNFRKAGYDLTSEQWVILVNLFEEDGVSQKQLAEKGYKNKASITSVLDGLEKKNYIKRVQNMEDKRFNAIYLSRQGRKLQEPLTAIARQTTNEFTQGITFSELEDCRAVLQKIISNAKK
jgi:DNA-binding MarR family transcriptional regulator